MLSGLDRLRRCVDSSFHERGDVNELAARLAAMPSAELEDHCFSQLLEWTGTPLAVFEQSTRVGVCAGHQMFFLAAAYLEALDSHWRTYGPTAERYRVAQLLVELLCSALTRTDRPWSEVEDHVFACFLLTCLEWCPSLETMSRIPLPPFLDTLVASHVPHALLRRSRLFASLNGFEPESPAEIVEFLRAHFGLPANASRR